MLPEIRARSSGISNPALESTSYSAWGVVSIYAVEPRKLVSALLQAEAPVSARNLIEASVHLPRRGSRWVAAFRDETGRQVWRSTGLRGRGRALAQARAWEEEAKRKRATQAVAPRKPTIRVRPGSGERELGLLTQAEVATIMKISERAVRAIERRAFDKLRRNPALRDFWREYATGEVKESVPRSTGPCQLSQSEIAAVYALARTPVEQRALRKILAVAQRTVPGRILGQ